MNKKVSIAGLPEFDPAEHMHDEADIAAYLTLVVEQGDSAELAHALGLVARASGMTEIAKAAGMTREGLYKALRGDSQPRYETVSRVLRALGLQLTTKTIAIQETLFLYFLEASVFRQLYKSPLANRIQAG